MQERRLTRDNLHLNDVTVKMAAAVISKVEIQKWWQVPAIAHFFKIFQKFLSSPQFDIDELEESLVGEDEENTLILDLIFNLLTSYFGRSVDESNLQNKLKQVLDFWSEDIKFDNPLENDTEFSSLSTFSKVQILYILCHLRMDCSDVIDIGNKVDFNIMNAQELGCDRQKAVYWYFYDTRVYKEISESTKPEPKKSPTKKKSKRQKEVAAKKDQPESEEYEQPSESWEIVCQTEEQWTQFIQIMSKSPSKNERELASAMEDLFNSRTKSLFEIKAREMKCKLLELTAKRESRRIAVKRKIKEEELEKEALEQEKRQKMTSNLKDRHRKLWEEEEAQRKSKEREQRLLDRKRAAEDRELRFKIRGTKASLSDDDSSNENSSSEPSFTATMYSKMNKLITDMFGHPDSWLFISAVDEQYAPNYYSIIKKPMYLELMKTKLKEKMYKSFSDLAEDFELLVSNCHTYNGSDSEYTLLANNLQRAYRRSCRKLNLQVNSEVVFVDRPSFHPIKISKPSKMHNQPKNGIDIPSDEYDDEASMGTDTSSVNQYDGYGSSSSDFDEFESIIEKKRIIIQSGKQEGGNYRLKAFQSLQVQRIKDELWDKVCEYGKLIWKGRALQDCLGKVKKIQSPVVHSVSPVPVDVDKTEQESTIDLKLSSPPEINQPNMFMTSTDTLDQATEPTLISAIQSITSSTPTEQTEHDSTIDLKLSSPPEINQIPNLFMTSALDHDTEPNLISSIQTFMSITPTSDRTVSPVMPLSNQEASIARTEVQPNAKTQTAKWSPTDMQTTKGQKPATPTWSYRSMSASNNNASTIKLQNISNFNCASDVKTKAVSQQISPKDNSFKNENNHVTLTNSAANNEDNIIVKPGSPLAFHNYGIHSITKDENGRTMLKLVKKTETVPHSSTS
ncbi:Cat eye syndrome critical region protein 2 [Nymphon striatum]|nr:Cat eye syndrome critical region protein 2 [Nymphon striatum]